MHRHMGGVGALSLAALMSLSSGASGELALSANDGKAVLIDGVNAVPANPPADSVTVIDLSATPPKVVAEIPAPTSVIGPPSSVAIARDESFALVTGASKIDPADPKKTVPDDKVTVIDLKASPPKVAAQLQAGQGAAGVSINRAGRQGQFGRRQIGPKPCRHHTGWQDGAGHPRRRQQDFGAVDRRQQGRAHQTRYLGGAAALRTRHPSQRQGRGCGEHRDEQRRCRYRELDRYRGETGAGRSNRYRRSNAGGDCAVPRRRLSRRGRGEWVQQGEEQPVLQRLRVGEGAERQRQRVGPADRGQGRPLVSGSWPRSAGPTRCL